MGKRLQRGNTAIGGRLLIEEDLLRPLARPDMEDGVQSLERLASYQGGAIEPIGVGFSLAQVARYLGLKRTGHVAKQTEIADHLADSLPLLVEAMTDFAELPIAPSAFLLQFRLGQLLLHFLPDDSASRLLPSMDEINYASDLIGRQRAQQGQANVAVALEGAEDQCNNEHLFVIAYRALVMIPSCQLNVETRILFHELLMDRPNIL